MKNIFLIGFMGCGKSTIAEVLANELAVPQVEMDEIIVKEQGMPIAEIFEKYGEVYFRDIETALVKRLKSEKGVVVSCGGGVVLREENRRLMKESGAIIWLTAKPETILERVKNSTNRPILNGHMNVEYIEGLMEKRRACYQEAADYVIETDGKQIDSICKEIIGVL